MKEYRLGYRLEPPDTRDLFVLIPEYDLPRKVDWTEQVTKIRDQGNEGSCVGFAVTALKEFQEWKQHGKLFDLSERWIYEWAKRLDEFPGEDYEGTTIRAAMKALAEHGICHEKFWEYVPGEKGEPDERAAEDAYDYKIEKYRSLTVPKKDIRLVMRGLHETGPIVAGVAIHKSWFEVGEDGIIQSLGWTAKVYGGHAILVVGYDDEFVKIKNSWGPRWGNKGFGFLELDYFVRILHSCWAAYDM